MRRLLVAVLLGALLVVAPIPPANAACPAPSGTPQPFPGPNRTPGTVSFTGGGWGHAIGLSQEGARGAATAGCTHGEILAAYYPTTALRTRANLVDLSVGLMIGGATPVTSSELVNTGSANVAFRHQSTTIGALRPGETLRITMASSNRARFAFGSRASWTQPAGSAPTITADLSTTRRLEVEGKTHWSGDPVVYNRGRMRIEVARERSNRFEHVVEVPMETYLLGLAEMPYAWPREALEAQAIAGRSFAQSDARARSDCTCTIYDSTRSQVYAGATLELASPTSHGRWRDAVESTAGRVLVSSSGNVVTAFYSASSGGVGQSLSEAWGGNDVGYIQAVNTAGWENRAGADNPRHRWVDDLSARSVASDAGLALLDSVEVTRRTSRGRASEVEIEGWTTGGRATTVTVSRDTALRSRFDLLSNYFSVTYTAGDRRRLSGANRHATAAAVARSGWQGGSDVAVVARSDDPTDALAGVVLAGHHDAPLMLSESGSLPAATLAEIQRLGATRALLLGGTSALGADVARDLQDAGIDTDRVSGANRYATMAAIARQTAGGAGSTAFIVRAGGPGQTWADTLAISGVAARRATEGKAAPVLGVGWRGLPPATVSTIRDLGIDEVVIVGGTAVVSTAQAAALADLGVTVRRWSGANRYLTSQEVARREPGAGDDLVVVTGGNFPDGLAAGALAGRIDATLMLAPNSFSTKHAPWRPADFPDLLGDLSARHDRTTAVGGTAALSTRSLTAMSWYLTPGAGAANGSTAAASVTSEAAGSAESGTRLTTD